jgi:hypothetical protein
LAGDWIKMRSNLWDHPKVVRIVSAICPQSVRDLSARCRIIGALFRTWALADAHTEDGILDGYDADALDSAVGIEGWSANLQHVGWLIIEPQRLILPGFTDHGGQTAKRRAEDAARKGRVRKASAKSPQPSGQNAEQRREEKRREEIEETPLPPALDATDFKEAWLAWESHRKEIKHPLKPTMVRAQLNMLAEMGRARAIACIQHTIQKGWQGLREPDQSPTGNHNGQPRNSHRCRD